MTDDGLERFAAQKLERLKTRALHRTLRASTRMPGAHVRRGASDLVSFACNDYLGLSQHPDVIAASCAATREFGAGAGASRHISGNHPLYEALEQRLAALKSTEDAVVFGSGYLTSIGVIPALVGREDLILIDELCHSCLFAGATLARCAIVKFAHNDAARAEALLAEHRPRYRHCLVVTEGVFSMDGDLAPLRELLAAAQRHHAWLMTDDAHGLGVVGGGRGSAMVAGQALPIPLQMGTLSKAAGTYGGYLCASRNVVDLIRNRARSLIYTTGLPPGVLAGADRALAIISENRELVAKPLANARLFARARGMPDPGSAIIPIVLGTPSRALAASRALEALGFLVVAIRPPTVPEGTARLRLAFSALHSANDVTRLAEAIDEAMVRL